jgi:hypothetical protein
MRVAVLSAQRYWAHHDIFPITVCWRELADVDIEVGFCHDSDDRRLANADVIFISSYKVVEVVRGRDCGKTVIQELVARLRHHGARVVWFDSSDGASVAHRWMASLVDVYAKAELFRDRTLYSRPLYRRELVDDFYRGACAGGRAAEDYSQPLDVGSAAKLDLAWNLAYADWRIHSRGRLRRGLGILFPASDYSVPLPGLPGPPLVSRILDISYRARQPPPTRAAVGFHRAQLERIVRTLGAKYAVRCEGILSFRDYRREIAQARIVLSPFGCGEICYRDFERFMARSILVKPDMSHLCTWPDLYVPFRTYVPLSWDFSDAETKLDSILQNVGAYQTVADEGHQRLLDVLCSASGRRQFAEHFRGLLDRALQAPNASGGNGPREND